ncbi:hypothetical protein SCP_0802160 [Sparassis crispa]|uniref:DEAD-box helicase OB fold domain-containing protein n=1 Tax=Sparassis crispa TaxID=139825 RepID=A0A401GVC2_9APHY|nr:hypothetical protein SCP_0802160 [Sparassis crispa]GBE85694.1 hypothetical protein SCP_0802160 [Sparassis crispa]
MVGLHPSCGLETQPEWVVFNEFVLTTRPYIRTVTDVRPEWLLEYATNYYDLSTLPDGETKRALQRVVNKRSRKGIDGGGVNGGGGGKGDDDRPRKKIRQR